MNVNLRTFILIVTHILLIKSAYSIIVHEPMNMFILLIGVIGAVYLIITDDIFVEKQNKTNSRKIQTVSGEYVESPEFINIFSGLEYEYEKKFKAIKNGVLKKYLIVFLYLVVAQLLIEMPITEKNNWIYFILEKSIAIGLWERAYSIFKNAQFIKIPYKQVFYEEFFIDFVANINSKLVFSTRKPDKEMMGLRAYLKNFFVEEGNIINLFTDGIISAKMDGKHKFRLLELQADRIFKTNKGKQMNSENVQGVFAITKTNINTKGYLKIVSHKKVISDYDRKNKVLLDSAEFEKRYNVFSPDKIFAHRVLTHDIMEILTEFGKYGIDFEVIIKNNFIFIRFYDVTFFELKNWNDGLPKEDLYLSYCVIKFAYELTKRINKSLVGFIG